MLRQNGSILSRRRLFPGKFVLLCIEIRQAENVSSQVLRITRVVFCHTVGMRAHLSLQIGLSLRSDAKACLVLGYNKYAYLKMIRDISCITHVALETWTSMSPLERCSAVPAGSPWEV